MKYSHFFWAIILITIGLLILVSNFGWIHFHWATIWQLWPLILVVWGISILPMKDLYKYVALGGVIVFTVLCFNKLTEPRYFFNWNGHNFNIGHNWDDDEGYSGRTSRMETQTLVVPVDTLSHKAELNLDAAAGNFKIEGLTSDLLSFTKTGDVGNYSLTTKDEQGRKVIRLQLEKSDGPRRFNKNQVNIRLNQSPKWDLNFNIGAASIEMNLKDYCIDTATIDAGASSIEITLGDKSPSTYLEFNAGASSVNVRIPKQSACEIRSESFLVSRDFEGFTKKGDGVYRSENFSAGKNMIFITVKTAVSSISVERY